VLLSLPDSRAVESVVFGGRPSADGLLAFARPGQVIIDLSTSAPSSTQRIHAAFAERGIEYLDAGISGGAAAAEQGTLTIMVGGSAAALQSVRWVLGPIAAKIVLMGASGAGHSTNHQGRLPRRRPDEQPDDQGRGRLRGPRAGTRGSQPERGGPLASFGVAANLGYGEVISNRVVDAIGDLAGGVRRYDVDESPEAASGRTFRRR